MTYCNVIVKFYFLNLSFKKISDCGCPLGEGFSMNNVREWDAIGITRGIHIACSSGYQQHGSERFVCLANGLWKTDLNCTLKGSIQIHIIRPSLKICLLEITTWRSLDPGGREEFFQTWSLTKIWYKKRISVLKKNLLFFC